MCTYKGNIVDIVSNIKILIFIKILNYYLNYQLKLKDFVKIY